MRIAFDPILAAMAICLLAALILISEHGARAMRPPNRASTPPARLERRPAPNSPQASQTASRSVCAQLRILTGFKTAAADT
jgi:hypothetical protein